MWHKAASLIKKKITHLPPFLDGIDEDRRRFLKLFTFGGGIFIAGKLFGDFFNFFAAEEGKTVFFRNFKVTENKKTLGIYDISGDEILVIDKDL